MIKLSEVRLAYKSNKPVLDGINMQLSSGQIYGLLGKNGEGKTTLLNLLSGQLFPDQGMCEVMGEEPRKRGAGFLQQLFHLPENITFPNVTGSEYIKMYAPFYPNFSQDICDTCLAELDVELNRRLNKMSLGQRKKVAIALALSTKTKVLLMDEPTNGLDIPSKAVFRRLTSSIISEDQVLVISTHQVRDLESLIDSVIILDKQRIALNQSLEAIGEKMAFRVTTPSDHPLYSESTPFGNMGVMERSDEEPTPVSLELLFNAVIGQPGEVKRIFNQ